MNQTPANGNTRSVVNLAWVLAAGVALLLSACGDPVPLTSPSEPVAVAAPASTTAPDPQETNEAAAGADVDNVVVTAVSSDFGQILVDGDGFSLYGFIDDVDGQSVCEGGCADAWPPVLVPDGDVRATVDSSVMNPSLFSVTERTDGTFQLRVGEWPLYYFAGDSAAGDTTGHLSGDVWFLVDTAGQLIDVPAQAEPEATAVPATAVPAPDPTPLPEPTAIPPTAVPPTAVPPTAVPPTAVPATAVPAVPAPTPGG